MGLFRSKPKLVTVRGRALCCLVCGGREFWSREVKLNSTGAEFLDLGWANRSATGVICDACGHVHSFVGNSVEFWKVDGGYPAGAE